MRMALVQVASSADEPVDERRRRVEELARSADGADLVVLPELWAVGYFDFDAYAAPVLDDRLPSYQHLIPNSTEADRS